MDLVATVAEPVRLPTSPLSGERGAFFHVEVLEDERVLGEAIFGDVVRLVVGFAGVQHAIDVLARNVRLGFPDTRPPPIPLSGSPPAELVPFVLRASGRGVLGWREHVVRVGDRLRLRTKVELHASRGVIVPEGAPFLLDVVFG